MYPELHTGVTNCRTILTEHGGNAEAPTTGWAGASTPRPGLRRLEALPVLTKNPKLQYFGAGGKTGKRQKVSDITSKEVSNRRKCQILAGITKLSVNS